MTVRGTIVHGLGLITSEMQATWDLELEAAQPWVSRAGLGKAKGWSHGRVPDFLNLSEEMKAGILKVNSHALWVRPPMRR